MLHMKYWQVACSWSNDNGIIYHRIGSVPCGISLSLFPSCSVTASYASVLSLQANIRAIASLQHTRSATATKQALVLHCYDPGILLGIHLGIVLGRSIITSACRYSRPGQLLSGSLPSPGETPGQHLSLRSASCAPSIYKRCTLAVAAGFSAGKHGSQRRRSLAAEPDGRHQRPRTKCVSLQSVACRVRLNACHD